MKTFLRRLSEGGALLAALFAATPAVLAAPPLAVSITAPANGATIGPLSSPANTVALTASATPSGGGAFITQIQFFVNGVSVGTSTAAPFGVNWTPAAPGTYTLTATATDSSAASNNTLTSAPVTVTISAVRLAAVSVPAANATVPQGSQIVVRGSASMSDGVVASVEFLLRDGVNPDITLGTSTSSPYFVLTPAVTATAGTYNLIAKATATAGAPAPTWESVASYPLTVVAQVGNGPAMSFVAPQVSDVLSVGTPVTVTATATDTDGFIPNSAPGGVAFYADGELISTDFTAPYSVSWTPALAKTVTLLAVGTDNHGNARAATRNVTVLAVAPTVAISAPANNSNATIGTPVTVSATATAGVGTTVSSVQFFADGVAIGAPDTVAPYTVSWTPTGSGSVALTARVADSNGTLVTSAAINVNVSAPGAVLSTTLTAPANGAAIAAGTTTLLTANANAAGTATVARVDFLAGTTIVGTALTAPYQASWIPTTAGVVALTSRVTDSNGATANSPIVNVSVTGPAVLLATNLAPGTNGAVGSPIALTATATPVAPATIANVVFLAGATVLGTVNSAPFTFDWTPATGGTFSLTARATDSNGAVVTSTAVSVTVGATPPTVSLLSPTSGSTVANNVATNLTATATASPGATVTRVDYFLNGTVALGTGLTAPFTVGWTPTTAGVASLTARVTDSLGATATSSAVLVTVSGGTTGGLAGLLTMTGSTIIPAGSTRALSVTPSGGAGVYDRVELYYDTVIVGTDTAPPYNFLFTAPASAGGHFLTARVVDATGLSANSNTIPINITSTIGVAPLASIVTPASGSFLGVGAATTITGIATDGDGSISGVQVFVNGALLGSATLAGSTWSIAWTPTVTGVASITAIATDNSGNSVAAPAVGVSIADSTSPNIALGFSPGAPSGGVLTLPSGATRNVLATVTPAVGRATVRVEFFVDGTKLGEDTSFPYTFRYLAPELAAGESSRTYVLSARATDNAGAARDVLQPILVVSPIGQPPAVNLITPANGAAAVPNAAVSLAASATATGGTIASVQFYVNGSPASVNAGNPITAAPYTSTFTPTAAGAYVIDAIATDDRGNTAVSSAATITAAFATPTIVFTAPNPNAVARATPGVPLPLAATATVQTGTGASILLVEFLLDGVQIGADTTAPYSFSWIPTAAHLGTRVLTARVTDTNSQTATSPAVTVNVANVVGSPPTVSVSASPIPPGLGLQTASTVNFLANAVATGGSTLSNVEIFLNDLSIGLAAREQTTNIYRLAYSFSRFDFSTLTPIINDQTGAVTYPVRLYAIARDSNNNQTVSATTNLVINPATSGAPSIALQGLIPTNINVGTQFIMAANSTDPDGTVTNIQLFANGVLVGNFPNPQPGAFLTYNATTAGRFNLYAVAIDDTGNTAVSTPAIVLNVTAIPAPATAITRPTDNSTVTTVNAPIFLEGTAVNSATNQVPTLQFVATSSLGVRQVINGNRVNANSTSYRAIYTPLNPDTYTITTQATVGIAQGTSAESRRVVVNSVQGLAPTISLTRAPGVSGFPGSASTASSADLCATATDPDGSIVSVEFFLDRNSIGQARRDPQGNTWRLTATFAGLQPGNNEIVALCTDSSGNVVASPTGNINITAPSSIAPSITITPSTTSPAFNRAVQLRANARDSDGTVTQVQYFANGTTIATSTNAGTLFLTNWTPTESGTYLLWAVATDNTGNTRVADTLEVNVRRNNPVLENAAFILQTYQDIANTTNINPLVFDQLDEQLGAGTLSRADLIVSPLTANGGLPLTDLPGFQAPLNLLATYYVLMGQWPTPQNYSNFLGIARVNLPAAVGGILNANEYFAKYGFVPTNAILDTPTSPNNAEAFLARLHVAAGRPPPLALDRVTFRSNNVLSATQGRGYAVVGLNQALAEFITNTNSTNTALFDRARAAALFYQLARPPVTMTVDEITARIDALVRLPTRAAIADAVLKDVLYGYRFVTITRHPQSVSVAPRSGVIFTVEAQGQPPLAYQWLLNGAPIAGATNALLSLTNVTAANAGTYTVAITSSAATATSDRAVLTIGTAPSRLANISTRGVTTGDGPNVLIGGFIVQGANAAQTRQMLIRVVGPTLTGAPFNLAGALPNPRLELYAGSSQTPVLVNDDWGQQTGGAAAVTQLQQAMQRAGAFNFSGPTSADAAVLVTLPPGPYTVQAKGPVNNPGATGVVLIEAYDVTQGGGAGPRAANVSTRGNVGTGANALIAGFVVNGPVSRRILVRGVGPTLAGFGVPGVLADPQLTLTNQATGQVIASNDNWASGADAPIIAQAAVAAGAFPLANGSRDSALLVMLPAGAYTVTLTGVANGTGVGIVEVYDVDP
ncbi:MAG: hypothetical protein JNK23_15410 [Opitutaceae bacterium]|nr:hypothetical protein [Opitutaceae bacterium]